MQKFYLCLISFLPLLVTPAKALFVADLYEEVNDPEVLSHAFQVPQTLSENDFNIIFKGGKLEDKWSSHSFSSENTKVTLFEDAPLSETHLFRVIVDGGEISWEQQCTYKVKGERFDPENQNMTPFIDDYKIYARPSVIQHEEILDPDTLSLAFEVPQTISEKGVNILKHGQILDDKWSAEATLSEGTNITLYKDAKLIQKHLYKLKWPDGKIGWRQNCIYDAQGTYPAYNCANFPYYEGRFMMSAYPSISKILAYKVEHSDERIGWIPERYYSVNGETYLAQPMFRYSGDCTLCK